MQAASVLAYKHVRINIRVEKFWLSSSSFPMENGVVTGKAVSSSQVATGVRPRGQ